MVNGAFDSTQSRLQKSMALRDGKQTRKDLILRANEILTTLRALLPSNYISDILGPNYTVFQNALAKESARLRLTGEDISLDNFYKFVRPEFLYRNLGYLIHGQEVKYSIPSSFSDKKYREFLLGILSSLLRGSTPESIEQGAEVFTEGDVKIIELFLQSIARQPNSNLDISDQFMWRMDVEVGDIFDSRTVDLVELHKGLTFFSEIIRPAHTLFDIRFILTEDLKIGQQGCQILLDEDGFLQAGSILIDSTITQTTKSGINDNKVVGIIDAIIDDFIFVANVPIKVLYTTDIQDVYGRPFRLLDLEEGMGVEINGIVVNPQINLGFVVKKKNSNNEICDTDHLNHFEYDYEDARKCCEDLREIVNVNLETVFNPEVTGNTIFRTINAPLVKPGSDPLELAVLPTDVTVFVNGFIVPVNTILPLEGTVVLQDAPPLGATIQISYSYFLNPIIPLTTNTPGSVLNGWGPFLIHSVIDPEIVASGIYIPPAIGIRHRSYLIDLSNQDLAQSSCDVKTLKYNWDGFQKTYSALTNSRTTFRLNVFDADNENYHKTNSFHIVTNIGSRSSKIGGENPGFNDRSPQPDFEETLNFPTPSVILTYKMRNGGDNFVFLEEDALNGPDAINDNFDLNLGQIIIEEDPTKNQYSLCNLSVIASGTSDSLSIACDLDDFNFNFGGQQFEEAYQIPGDLEDQGYLILNFFPIMAIAESPVQSFELDIETQQKHSLNKGRVGFNFTQSTNGSDVIIHPRETYSEFMDFDPVADYVYANNEVYADNYFAASNNFLITNFFQTESQEVTPETDEKAFVPPNPGYMNDDFVQNTEESIINQDADIVGTTPAEVEFNLITSQSHTLNDFSLGLIAVGGYRDELVSVTLDGGNPWTDIQKVTEESD